MMPIPHALFKLQFLGFYIMVKTQLLREGSSVLEEISNLSFGGESELLQPTVFSTKFQVTIYK